MQSTHHERTGFHGNSDDMTNMPCLIMQYKPYIVEQPPRKLLWEMKLLLQYTCIFYCRGIVSTILACIHIDQFDHYALT